ncbi:MAG: hypothetical protein N2748_05115, partial [candidate division WOR-3 bacterium]|nr:hypothetical protein [candidate division WOR-3 bacterium]
MKATFPHLGYDTFALRNFLWALGAEVTLPPATTERTLSVGTKHSPELICLPFKITLGNFIEALEAGADTLFMAAGARKCRFGYYHYLQENILKNFGNGFRFYAISQYTPLEFVFKKMPAIFSVSPQRVLYALFLLLNHCALIEDFRKLIRRARVVNFAESVVKEKQALDIITNVKTIKEIRSAREKIKKLFCSVNTLPKDTIKVGLVGEVYLMLENFANHDIEKELGKLGVLVLNPRSLYRHLKHLLHFDISDLKYYYYAHRYLKESPGGEAINSVGETYSFLKQGVDGIIHIFPFTCMPENIASEAIQKISDDYSLPVLSLSIDEHTS